MKTTERKIIKIYQKDNGESPFIDWLESLDITIKHRIQSRLARVAIGNLGEYKLLGDNIHELKFKFGSGYRIYYSELDDVILLLLCAGDKKTQSKDIKMAKDYLRDYLEGESHGQKYWLSWLFN